MKRIKLTVEIPAPITDQNTSKLVQILQRTIGFFKALIKESGLDQPDGKKT